MRNRAMVLPAVLAFIGLPGMLALVEAASFHVVNRNNGAIVSSGVTREYLLHVPRSYARTRPTPLVISMHAAGLWPAAQMEISQ
jgi:poly(3-hydroxybutyrate) depolymerase